MKFPRNARIFRGQFDAAPFLGVFFLLAIFLLLAGLVYTPGVRIQLPEATTDLPGTDNPTVAVAVDANGQLFFDNRLIGQPELESRLREAVAASTGPLTLVVQADKAVNYDTVLQIALLARKTGFQETLMATLPRILKGPAEGTNSP